MNRKHLTILCMAVAACNAMAAPGNSVPIALQGSGPYHQLTLPAAIYGHAAHADLRDLRITNGAGHAVPFAWLQSPPAEQRTESHDVPMFAWPQSTMGVESPDAVLAFTVRPNGSLALVKPRTAKATPTSDWLLDVSQLKGRLLQARLTVQPGTQGLFPFTLEASDDLRRWHRVGGDEQLVLLQQGGQTIERLSVDLQGVQARFLRLHWLDPQHSAPLIGVGIDTVQSTEPLASVEWSGPLPAEQCTTDYCDYVLPRGVPAQSLRVHLADANTLAAIHVSGVLDTPPVGTPVPVVVHNPLYALRRLHRQTARPQYPQEVPLLDTVVYRLTQPGGEARSPDLPLNGAVVPRLRLRTDGPVAVLGSTHPMLEVATPLRSLVFLAQGQPPYSLTWSTIDSAAGAPLALATLIPGYARGTPLHADPASIALASAAPVVVLAAASGSAAAASGGTRKPWLWAALLVGLGLLAGMAWSLFRNFQKDTAPPA